MWCTFWDEVPGDALQGAEIGDFFLSILTMEKLIKLIEKWSCTNKVRTMIVP